EFATQMDLSDDDEAEGLPSEFATQVDLSDDDDETVDESQPEMPRSESMTRTEPESYAESAPESAVSRVVTEEKPVSKPRYQPVESGIQIRTDEKLLKMYTEARRDAHEVISSLVDTLGRVDNLPEDQLEQVRDALFHTDFPFLLVLVGPFSSGKSSVINALLGENVLDVGPIPTTDHIHILRYGAQLQTSRGGEITTVFHPHPLLNSVSFVDTPGLESVIEQHDKVTRRFLHRADLVLLVMVATHVLSASNLDFLRELKAYGKRTIIVVNQVDVLNDEEREAVQTFVEEQGAVHLGLTPTIWMVSAKQAMEAQRESPRDEIIYDESGFAEVEEYITETLNDSVRIKQKLETSLQICNNVRGKAESLVEANQTALTEHQKTLKNIDAQAGESVRVQKRTADEGLAEIDKLWAEASQRGSEAIGELFQFTRAFGQIFSGLGEIIGLASLIRRFGRRTRAQAAFDKHEVAKALNKVPEAVDRLGARLEGRDLQDIDDLVEYTRDQVEKLPPNLKDKVIGKIQSPMSYDRSFLRRVRDDLDDIIQEAGRFETSRLDRQLRNSLIVLAIWEIIVMAITLSVGIASAQSFDALGIFILFGAAILVALLGMFMIPLRGWMLERAYGNRMFDFKERYLKILREILQDVIDYGATLRRG
ncbi:MAG TPA: dynamin family protein, partial [Aggregatilineales bacterium]|nr:dynamin family protein [Aggregatilineales bacterium]